MCATNIPVAIGRPCLPLLPADEELCFPTDREEREDKLEDKEVCWIVYRVFNANPYVCVKLCAVRSFGIRRRESFGTLVAVLVVLMLVTLLIVAPSLLLVDTVDVDTLSIVEVKMHDVVHSLRLVCVTSCVMCAVCVYEECALQEGSSVTFHSQLLLCAKNGITSKKNITTKISQLVSMCSFAHRIYLHRPKGTFCRETRRAHSCEVLICRQV